jgi:Methylamine utilisation protein MauE
MTEAVAMSVDPLLVWIAAACIATLFAHGAATKAFDASLLEQHLAAYGVPLALLGVAARVLPLVEAVAAVLLLTPWRAAGALLAALLLLLYAGVMAFHRARGHVLDCGCGGEPLPVSWALVARNVLLTSLCAVAAAPVSARAVTLADFFVVAGALLMATLLYAALHQVLRHRAGSTAHTAFRRS